MGWLIALGLIVLFACIPLGVNAFYNESGANAVVFLGPFRRVIYPVKKNGKPEKKIKSKTTDENASNKKHGGGAVADFIPFVRLILRLLEDFRGRLLVNIFQLNVILAGSDPCDLGQNYGKACAAWANFQPHFERFLNIQKRDIKILCDFEASQTVVSAHIVFTIRLYQFFSLCLKHGIHIVKEYLQIMKKHKGGVQS